MENSPLYLHCFNLVKNFGPNRLFRLCQYFPNFEKAYHATYPELIASGLENEIAEAFLNLRNSLNLNIEKEKLDSLGIYLLSYKDPAYPKLLLEIEKFPALLYCRGTAPKTDELCIATVGTRKITTYGKLVTAQIVENLALQGATIVSGLAYGVDSACHQAVINVQKRTVGVLAGGIDDQSIYPQHHVLLVKQILDLGGMVISEYPPKTSALKHHFIARNRIISGMSVATIVVECSLDSGSLITAKYALEQNRNVYAVPGPIYAEQSKGPNNLIKMGARLITSAEDILQDLNLENLPKEQEVQSLFGNSPDENIILKILSLEPQNINSIIKQSGLDPASATSALTFLEMKGKVRNLGGQQYCLAR
jgi:DNA processing protein